MFLLEPRDRFGEALHDYYSDRTEGPLLIHNKYGDPEEYPLDGFFFSEEEFTEMEDFALSICKGNILDVGSAAGRHVLVLEEKEKQITGLDSSGYCCEVMKMRGVQNIAHCDIYDFDGTGFDTVLMLMNGIGLTGTISGLQQFLNRVKKIIKPTGQLIFDSSNIRYLYEGINLPSERYYGEMDFCYEYRGLKGPWFTWLYIDQDELKGIASENGWVTQIIYEDDSDRYLARLVCS